MKDGGGTAPSSYEDASERLRVRPRVWLVTGVAGFIGSNLLETLLELDQEVVGLDDFSTGHRRNLEEVRDAVDPGRWKRFRFIEGDIRDLSSCREACTGADIVLHQAALGSVPRSIEDPIRTNQANIDGFVNMLVASRDVGVRRFVYAASSSTYGGHTGLPKVEEVIGKPLSPYAVTKFTNELYADVFAKIYGVETIGLRYFNVFGRRQDPLGAYAAVIPKWFDGLLTGDGVFINGDGETSRDFCYIDNCIQANLLAATASDRDALNQVYNVAVGERTTLNELFRLIRDILAETSPAVAGIEPSYRDFRPGDVRHSLADVSKARRLLGYDPLYDVEQGLWTASSWYRTHSVGAAAPAAEDAPERR